MSDYRNGWACVRCGITNAPIRDNCKVCGDGAPWIIRPVPEPREGWCWEYLGKYWHLVSPKGETFKITSGYLAYPEADHLITVLNNGEMIKRAGFGLFSRAMKALKQEGK